MRKYNNSNKLEVIHIGYRFISQFLGEEYEVSSNYIKDNKAYATFKKNGNTLRFGLDSNLLDLNFIKIFDKTFDAYLIQTLEHIVTKNNCRFRCKNNKLELSVHFNLKDTEKYGEIIGIIDDLIKYF